MHVGVAADSDTIVTVIEVTPQKNPRPEASWIMHEGGVLVRMQGPRHDQTDIDLTKGEALEIYHGLAKALGINDAMDALVKGLAAINAAAEVKD